MAHRAAWVLALALATLAVRAAVAAVAAGSLELARGVSLAVARSGDSARLAVTLQGGRKLEFSGLALDAGSALAHARVLVAGEHGLDAAGLRAVHAAARSSTFRRELEDGRGWVVATRLGPGEVHAVVAVDGEVIHVQPLSHGAVSEADRRQLREAAGPLSSSAHMVSRGSLRDLQGKEQAPQGQDVGGSAGSEAGSGVSPCGALALRPEARSVVSTAMARLFNGSLAAGAEGAIIKPLSGGLPLGKFAEADAALSKSHSPASSAATRASASPRRAGPRSLGELGEFLDNELYASRASRWSGCFPGQDRARFFETGIVADYGFVSRFPSPARAVKAIEAMVASANMVLGFQLNVQVRLRQLLVVAGQLDRSGSKNNGTSGGSTSNGTRASSTRSSSLVMPDVVLDILESDLYGSLGHKCKAAQDCVCDVLDPDAVCSESEKLCGIAQGLSAMTTFSGVLYERPFIAPTGPQAPGFATSFQDLLEPGPGQLSNLAHWHLLTGCYDSPGVIGVAWLLSPSSSEPRRGTSCLQGLNTAVTSLTRSLWLTFTHELGHSLGASHTFQEGERTTGGIMDYGDGKYKGLLQFNEKHSRSELCEELTLLTEAPECHRKGESALVAPGSGECSRLPGAPDSDPSFYCEGGFCPVEPGGNNVGRCRPLPSALIAGSEEVDFRGSIIGEPLSGLGVPVRARWRLPRNSTLCSLGTNNSTGSNSTGTAEKRFEKSDIVLVKRGGCTFDDKAANAHELGAGAVIVYDSNASAVELLSAEGSETELDIRFGFISAADGARISARIAQLEAQGETLLGYFGAAPPGLIRARDAPEPPEEDAGAPSPNRGDEVLIIASLAGSAVLLVLLVVCCYANARRRAANTAASKEMALAIKAQPVEML
jgi:hypothetical protein